MGSFRNLKIGTDRTLMSKRDLWVDAPIVAQTHSVESVTADSLIPGDLIPVASFTTVERGLVLYLRCWDDASVHLELVRLVRLHLSEKWTVQSISRSPARPLADQISLIAVDIVVEGEESDKSQERWVEVAGQASFPIEKVEIQTSVDTQSSPVKQGTFFVVAARYGSEGEDASLTITGTDGAVWVIEARCQL